MRRRRRKPSAAVKHPTTATFSKKNDYDWRYELDDDDDDDQEDQEMSLDHFIQDKNHLHLS